MDVCLILMAKIGRNGGIYWNVESESSPRHKFSDQRYDDKRPICCFKAWPTGWLFSLAYILGNDCSLSLLLFLVEE
jgi:hypothetical protein